MSWLAFHRTEAASALIGKHPAAFLLLSCIAIRARFHPDPCPVTGLEFGQCFLGDWQECGQKSYKQYRVSKGLLEKMKFAAFKGTSKGTIASLLQVTESSMIYSVSISRSGQPEGQAQGQSRGNQGANEGPLTNKDIRIQGEREAFHALTGEEMTKTSGELIREIKAKINSCDPRWESRPSFTYQEDLDLKANLRYFTDLTETSWTLVRDYLDAEVPKEGKFWQPDSRGRFIQSISDVFIHAERWKSL